MFFVARNTRDDWSIFLFSSLKEAPWFPKLTSHPGSKTHFSGTWRKRIKVDQQVITQVCGGNPWFLSILDYLKRDYFLIGWPVRLRGPITDMALSSYSHLVPTSPPSWGGKTTGTGWDIGGVPCFSLIFFLPTLCGGRLSSTCEFKTPHWTTGGKSAQRASLNVSSVIVWFPLWVCIKN